MTVYINGDGTIPQPTLLLEDYVQIQTDNYALDGGGQRNRLGQKKFVNAEWRMLTPAEYLALTSKFTTGSGVTWFNDQSKFGTFQFDGLPTYEGGEYEVGATMLSPVKASIREI